MTIEKIKEELKARGVEFNPDDSPEKLCNLLNEVMPDAKFDLDPEEVKSVEKKVGRPKKTDLKPASSSVEVINRVPDVTPPPPINPRRVTMPGEKGGEYSSVKLVEGRTEEITMLVNIRHDNERFYKDEKYVVSNQLAEKFKENGWAE